MTEAVEATTTERVAKLEGIIEQVGNRLDGVDRRFDGVDRRFDGVDRRLDGIHRRLDWIVGIQVTTFIALGSLILSKL